MNLVVLADTHGKHSSLSVPDGDILVHAGDFTERGTFAEVHDFARWWDDQPHDHKIIVAGNHERKLERGCVKRPDILRTLRDVSTYLEDGGCTIDGIEFYGSPWTPTFNDWAFQADEDQLDERFGRIPSSTDVLVTHGPPRGILDRAYVARRARGMVGGRRTRVRTRSVGSTALKDRVRSVEPEYHVFGHIHEQYGETTHGSTRFINASLVDDQYNVNHEPVRVSIE